MFLQGRGTRRRPCDSRLECPPASTSSLLGFYWRPLQRAMRPLQVWRVTTSVESPYIPMLGYNSSLSLIPVKNADPASNGF